MSPRTLAIRSLTHHWRAHVAVVLGVVAGTAALTGALLVGDALRGSLRATALDRLGQVACVARAPRYFRTQLANDAGGFPAILARGSATAAGSGATAHRISVLGVDGHFWSLGPKIGDLPATIADGAVVLNQALAADLGVHAGDDVLLRVAKPAAISPETLLGRRDETTATLRLTVARVIPADGLGAFTLTPQQIAPRNAYVSLATLQQAYDRRGRANTILFAEPRSADAARAASRENVTLDDLGLRVHSDAELGCIALESNEFLLSLPVEQAGRTVASERHWPAVGLLAYLANSIADEGRPATPVPYSTVVAAEPSPELLGQLTLVDGSSVAGLDSGEILLNDWTARELGAQPGDTIRLSYYVTATPGQLETKSAAFRLRGVVQLAGAAADPGLTPTYPGVTDSDTMADWDPPFPIDLRKIRKQDEEYWHAHRATPKAFVTLADGQRLWASDRERFGQLTALRVYPPPGDGLEAATVGFGRELLKQLDPAMLGLRVEDVRARALTASRGTTDFAGLFVGFSFFVIVSAALLVALLFRLNVERRAHEVGLLLAVGFERRRVGRLLLQEGLLLALLGAALGLPAARGYAWLMVAGLRTWWSAAVNAPFLQLQDTAGSYAIGALGGVVVAGVSMAWALRGLTRTPPRALLAGVAHVETFGRRRGHVARALAIALVIIAGLALALSLTTDWITPTTAFFVSGTSLLCGGLAALAAWLRGEPHLQRHFTGRTAVLRLGIRNARRHVGRSLLTAGLIASATFLITSLQAMHLTPTTDPSDKFSGTGGFTLLAETDVPLTHDLATRAGREALGFSDDAEAALAGVTFFPTRLHDGDEASCLNLYAPTQPRILGVSDALIDRGGFHFAATLATTDAERNNPWQLLRQPLSDGAIPAFADEAAALWQLHVPLGGDVVVQDERGQAVRLRLVGLLKGSVLQGELLIAEPAFVQLFPSVAGYAFYFVETPKGRAAEVKRTLEHELSAFGCAVTDTTQRLAELQSVQNTYLSTFQSLGGLGLLLGSVGLAAVLLRNVWERRSELALLRTLGFSRAALGAMVLIENAFLVAMGLVTGFVCAAIVAAPQVVLRDTPMPWGSLAAMFAAILAIGLAVGAAALAPVLRAPLLPALRSE